MFESATLDLLTSPAILFFVLGCLAAAVRSDLTIPEPISKALSLYLMLCIGFKGGVAARAVGLSNDFVAAALIGLAISALAPLLAFLWLRRTRLDKVTVCALAATYGSVSVVTFAAGEQHLDALGLPHGGYMVAVLALMETPAILTALLLMNRNKIGGGHSKSEVLREVLTGPASVLLVGSFVIGLISGQSGMDRLELFVGPMFQGALCFFLLDLGLAAVRRIMGAGRKLSRGVLAFAIGFPLLSAATALGLSRLAGLSPGDAALMAILAGSASYIAAPAAMRVAAPEADEGVYVSASLAVTFPFNLLIGIPLYTMAASWITT